MYESIFAREGDLLSPFPPATSPYSPKHQSGIVVAGLLTHLVDEAASAEPMEIARITIDLLGSVPFAPVSAAARVIRDGRRTQHLEAVITADGTVVARAFAVRVRVGENPPIPMAGAFAPPEDAPAVSFARQDGIPSCLETRLIYGGYPVGPGRVWARPAIDLFPGVRPSFAAGAAMTADLGSGTSGMLDRAYWSFPNIDLSINFARAPTSEWILVDGRSVTFGNGRGLAEAVLADRDGPFARSQQTQFINRLPSA